MKRNKKEDFEIAREHISLAEDIVLEEEKLVDNNSKKILKDASFSLEKAEAGLEDCENKI